MSDSRMKLLLFLAIFIACAVGRASASERADKWLVIDPLIIDQLVIDQLARRAPARVAGRSPHCTSLAVGTFCLGHRDRGDCQSLRSNAGADPSVDRTSGAVVQPWAVQRVQLLR